MQKIQNLNSHVSRNTSTVFVNFKPAELRIGSQWLVVYYAKNPQNEKMERFRVPVPSLKNITERKKLGKKLAFEINEKLYSGWLPYYSSVNGNSFRTFEYCKDKFLEYTNKEIKDGSKRPDTLRAYNSFLNMLSNFIKTKSPQTILILHLNKQFVVNYLDWIYYDRNNSATTHNNHLTFIINFLNFCLNKGLITENYAVSIKRKTEEEKIRQILTEEVKEKVKKLKTTNFHFYTLCMATYFCFIRRTELTKLKVCDVSLINNCISIKGENSKNKKTESVTIPKIYASLLSEHLKNANNEDYLFSNDNFKTGKVQLKPKKISDEWNKFRNANNISNVFQFYSLKDTGITDLLKSGLPAIKVRDQARHYDLKITEKYTARNKTFDTEIVNSSFDF